MKIHKGWYILLLLFLTMVASLGFGRFSLGAILPFMKDGLQFDYRQMGFIASAAFIGYLISVTFIGHFVIKFSAKKVINFSLLLVCFGMILCANAQTFSVAFVSCFLLGIGSGGSSIPAMGLAGRWFSNKKKGMAIGTAMGGLGIGIVIGGLLVPQIVSISVDGWRTSWYILSIVTIIFVCFNAFYLKNSPEEVGLKPIGEFQSERLIKVAVTSEREEKPNVYKNKQVWLIGIMYMSWGLSYIVFSTFLVDYLMVDRSFSKELAGLFFSIAGLVSVISGFLWGAISDRYGRMLALTILFSIQFFILFLMTITNDTMLLLAEIIVYGLTLWGVPTIMNAAVADFVSLRYVPVAMGFVTIFFAIGQIISPVITGLIIDMTKEYLGAFYMSSAICFIGAAICMNLHLRQVKKDKVSEMSM